MVIVLPYLVPLSAEGKSLDSLILDGGRFITVNGIQTYVVEKGPVDGTPLFFIHGLFGSTFSARNQIEPFAEAGFRVIAYDRPGFGLTEKPYRFDYSDANQAEFATHLLDALDISKAIIWAHSGGGAIQMHFALNHPERVQQMITVDGAILGGGGGMAYAGLLLSIDPIYRWAQVGAHAFFRRERMAAFLEGFYADPTQVTDEAIAGYWRICETANWERGVLGQVRDTQNSPFTQAQLSQIKAETLLIWGEADPVTPLSDGEILQGWLPNSSLQTIPEAGHLPMEEFPVQFNHLVLNFLEGNKP